MAESKTVVKLNRGIRSVMLQFRVNREEDTLSSLRWTEWKPAEKKRYSVGGVRFIDPTELTSLHNFTYDILLLADYILVDAFRQQRTDHRGRNFYVMRFVFTRREFVANLTEEFKAASLAIRDDLDKKLCTGLAWLLEAHLNQYSDNPELLTEGTHTISINVCGKNKTPRPRNYLWLRNAGVKILPVAVNGSAVPDEELREILT